jgi:hypothetical protein
MRITRRGTAALLVLALLCSLAVGALVGCSGADQTAMVEAGAEFIVALVNADGATLLARVPPSIAEENPEYADAVGMGDEIVFTQEWDGDVLVVGTEDAPEAYRFSAGEAENVVLLQAEGETIELAMESVDGAWVVTQVDGDPVDELLEVMLVTTGMDPEAEVEAEVDTMICHGEQLIWMAAAAVLLDAGRPVTQDPSDYIPDLIEAVSYCPSPDSQYSAEKSTNGYLDGMGEDGTLEPCSVHGAPEDE